MIHDITWALVLTSGAGMSRCGPISGAMRCTSLRVSRSSSPCDIVAGSQQIPPFAPPKGMFTSAVFQVIRDARDCASSASTLGWKRRPPFIGPRAELCCMRYPLNTPSSPLSSSIGSVTVCSASTDSSSRSTREPRSMIRDASRMY